MSRTTRPHSPKARKKAFLTGPTERAASRPSRDGHSRPDPEERPIGPNNARGCLLLNEQHSPPFSVHSYPSTIASGLEGNVSPLLVCKILACLLAFDALGLNRSFSRLHRFVSNWKLKRRTAPAHAVESICKAVNRACVWYPKRVLCLQRSAVTTCMLRSCGVAASMVMGAQIFPFKAHAWTEVDGRPVNERRAVQTIYSVWERC